MATVVYGIAKNEGQAIRVANRLRSSGFDPSDISVLAPDARGVRDLGHQNSTKAPEGAAVGAGTGAILGGAVGWLAGVGLLAVPGLGPLIAAGPILATLSGMAIGTTAGGLTGAMVGLGIPEYEAQQYEGKLRQGNILLAVHTESGEESARVREIFNDEDLEDISTGSEASVPHETRA
jgi:hypothetical protein